MNDNLLRTRPFHNLTRTAAAAAALLVLATGCATTVTGEASPDRVIAVTANGEIIEFVAGRPERILARRPLIGIQNGERIVGMNFRPSNGRLYAVGNSGQLYLVNLSPGIVEGVGRGGFRTLASGDLGVDFNPAVDRIRMVNGRGGNLRIHPDTGAVIDTEERSEGVQVDGELVYAQGDVNAGRTQRALPHQSHEWRGKPYRSGRQRRYDQCDGDRFGGGTHDTALTRIATAGRADPCEALQCVHRIRR